MIEKYYTVGEVADILGMSNESVRKRIRLGSIFGAVRRGRNLYVSKRAVESYIKYHME